MRKNENFPRSAS
jgi:hypothetical protein